MTLLGSLRAAGTTLGWLLLVLGIIANRNEQGRAQSFILEAWARLGDVGERATTRHVRFINRVARAGLSMLTWLLGESIVSLRVLWVALFLSGSPLIASFAIALALFGWFLFKSSYADHAAIVELVAKFTAQGIDYPKVLWAVRHILMTAGSYAGLAIVPALVLSQPKSRRRPLIAAYALGVLISFYRSGFVVNLWYLQASAVPSSVRTRVDAAAMLAPLLLVGLLSDLVTIAVTRWALRRCASTDRWISGLLTLIGVVVLGLSVSVGLVAAGWKTAKIGLEAHSELLHVGSLILISACANGFDLVLILLVGLNIALLLVHRLIWPLLIRPLERLYEVVPDRKVIVGVGLALLAASTTTGNDLLKGIVTAVVK